MARRTGNRNFAAKTYPQARRGGISNLAMVVNNPTVHTPLADTTTPFAGMLLKAQGSGLFVVAMSAQLVAVAADLVTWEIETYEDAVQGVPMTLPANASAQGQNCFTDSTGAGIAPSAGATAPALITAQFHTIGTGAANDIYSWGGIVGGGVSLGRVPIAVPVGRNWYVTLAVADSVAARAIGNVTLSAFEIPSV
jgi:hypothetical protein